jgi:hypothetical protein
VEGGRIRLRSLARSQAWQIIQLPLLATQGLSSASLCFAGEIICLAAYSEIAPLSRDEIAAARRNEIVPIGHNEIHAGA